MIEQEYYTREYQYLISAGKKFKKSNPEIATFLNIGDDYQQDPFVERLCQSFAFLTGTIHKQLDDDFSKVAGLILEHIFPELLRPFPSCSILCVDVNTSNFSQPQLVPRGEKVKGSWRKDGNTYDAIFQTTQELTALPLKIGVPYLHTNKSIRVPFTLAHNARIETWDLSSLPFFVNGREQKHYKVLYYLLDKLETVSINFKDIGKTKILNRARVEIYGLGSHHSSTRDAGLGDMLSVRAHQGENSHDEEFRQYLNGQFRGHRLLFEYFSFVQRFFCLELQGLEDIDWVTEGWSENYTSFEIVFDLKEEIELGTLLDDNDILINAVPIINMYTSGDTDVDGVRIDGTRDEYEVRPANADTEEIYAITGIVGEKGVRYVSTVSGQLPGDTFTEPPMYYTTSIVKGKEQNNAKAFIQLIQNDSRAKTLEDNLSIRCLLTNGSSPSQLGKKGIDETLKGNWAGLKVFNEIQPTKVKNVVKDGQDLWLLISHMTTSLRTLAESSTLKKLLGLYNSDKDGESNQKIEGIKSIREPTCKTLYKDGGFKRVLEVVIEIDQLKFPNKEAGVYLFGTVLRHFLSEYVTMNTYLQLRFVDVSGTNRNHRIEYIWKPLQGNTALI